MPRRAVPRFDPRRGRWYGAVGAFDRAGRRREVYAPPTIGPGDEARAREWFEGAEAAREEAESGSRPSGGPRHLPGAWTFDRGDRLEALALLAAEAADRLRGRKRAGLRRRVSILEARASRLRALALSERMGGGR